MEQIKRRCGKEADNHFFETIVTHRRQDMVSPIITAITPGENLFEINENE